MTSGSHLSKELLDLVKSIGESRSKQEEDRIISSEASLLKIKFTERNLSEKKMKELLIRAIYVEMLGHDASFSHIYAVNLTQSKNLLVKRIGYLAASLFIDQNSEMIILMISTMQKDLQSRNHLEVIAALNCLSKLCNISVMLAVNEAVIQLLEHQHEMIRKKAVMVLIKFNKLQIIENMDIKMKKALCDKDPSVMACALNYFQEQIKKNPTSYIDLVNHFIIILKQIIDHRLPRDFDYHRIPAPWIQIKILEILSYLGVNNEETSKQMYEIITIVLKRSDDSASNVGYALVYQCLRTITRIYPSQELLDLTTLTISRFLSSTSKNLKYMGIVGLIQIVKIDPKYTLDYQNMVVDCLEDADDTLKIRTLDLLYKMTNKQNVEPIVEKLLSYLKGAPIESTVRKDLVIKINELGEKFAPTKSWYIRTMNKVFELGGDLITQIITNNFIASVNEYQKQEDGEAFSESTIKIYLKVLKKNPSIPESLMQVIAWIMGEYGPDLNDQQKIAEIEKELCIQAYVGYENNQTVCMIISALLKLHLSKGFAPNPLIESVMRDFSNSKHISVQQRCFEYQALKEINQQLPINGREIFKNVPNNEEQAISDGIDFDLSFLNQYTQEKIQQGLPTYDKEKSLLFSNLSSGTPQADLNFKAYQQEQPKYSTIYKPGPSAPNDQIIKETLVNNPVFNQPIQTSVNQFEQQLQVKNVKQIWGANVLQNQQDSNQQPNEIKNNQPLQNQPQIQQKVKKEPKTNQIDEKKQKLKDLLFSGIQKSKEKDSDDSESEKKQTSQNKKEETNLLDFDSGNSSIQNEMNILQLDQNFNDSQQQQNNLLDILGTQNNNIQQKFSNIQFDSILTGFSQNSTAVKMQQYQIKYQGIPGFNTAQFGLTWMQMQNPQGENKFSVTCPLIIGSQSLAMQPEQYSKILSERIGVQKIEIINNEVIAAGTSLENSQFLVLIHCRVTQAQLEFTVRSQNHEISAQLMNDLIRIMV